MIRETNAMIAGCIDRMRHESCDGCERRDACASLFNFRRSAGPPGREQRYERLNPLLAFLGNIAKAIEASAKPRERPFTREVERRVEPLLASRPVRIEQVAGAMGLSRQTLYRRLKAEGVTFEALLDRLRHRLALRLVRDGLAVKDVAYRLGFSDPAAFSRAFKRWTGSSPSAARG